MTNLRPSSISRTLYFFSLGRRGHPGGLLCMTPQLTALDLFAGSGWGVAAHRLGILEHGVEIMDEAVATREAAGFSTIFRDVWDGLLNKTFLSADAIDVLEAYDVLIASPPCQTFSAAGKGAGRKALDEVLGLIRSRVWADPFLLKRATDGLDPRTALVLVPLAYIRRDRPRFVALEQVPSVLPVWEAYAEVMRAEGYSVATGILNAEQYGVPQTRRRAILVARRDGTPAKLPTPTHSRYYSRTPERLDEDVEKWVSMAEALGWTLEPGDGFAVRTGMGAGMIERHGPRPPRDVTEPAFTVLGGNGGNSQPGFGVQLAGEWVGFPRLDDNRSDGAVVIDGVAYRKRDLRRSDHPALTVTEKARSWQRFPDWAYERPATTVAGDPRVWPPGHKVNAADIARLGEEAAREKYGDRAGTRAIRLTPAEAAVLQTYPEGFAFSGSKTNTFLQIGNAVPPLLAEAILSTFLD